MRIAFIIDSMQRHLFFIRLANALKSEHEIFFISSEPLSILLARIDGFSGIHISRRQKTKNTFARSEILEIARNSIETLNSAISIDDALIDATVISESILSYIEQNRIGKLVIWNGQQLMGRAATLSATRAGVKTKYLELANLPGKLFSDPDGVNALSSIARSIDIIDRLPDVPDENHQKWLRNYEVAKSKPLPQAQRRLKNTVLSSINVALKSLLKSTCPIAISKKKRSLKKPLKSLPPKASPSSAQKYIFLPLQVSSDTQIKLHSNHNNIEAIRFAHNESERSDADLIVKIHPAEISQDEIERIITEQERLGFTISSNNTIELIKNSASVITINSTVGLEALLYGKPVTTLGKCLYREFDRERLKKYIHHYLVDGIEYFENIQINPDAARKLIQ